ncbi:MULTISPECIES: helix-turn-helix domain-containing protein [Prevotellaceae]|uniref:helix-turn-helix domain-containing protein n=1 Tax=Prevotellaceae TaxID=171552 RepID=UPI000353CCCC|nr:MULTISPECIES: helix-turn-helix transcriptional regulator [Prevotellaceae]EPH18725.1 hypothetical protein HMPREF1475_00633 [Hoylesella oralis HGA0225]ETD21572.1 hypothetical protein HMPREF1199_00646 [Hoylesella oralis CC98A]SHF76730.1 DNA-binding transcriptional regulator, XRE-family HTH domain [Hoylesella oralis]
MKYIKQDVLVRFGQIVRRYREDMNISQEELAFRAGLHRTYIGMIERAEKNVTLCNIKKIADALGIDIKDLFD